MPSTVDSNVVAPENKVTMVNLRQTIFSLALITLSVSCGSMAPSDKQEGQVETVVTAAPKDLSNTELMAYEARQSLVNVNDPHRILGSSKIVDPDNHGTKTYYLYGAEHLKLENYYFDFPVVYNEAVQKWLNYFQKRGRDYFERYSARAGRYAPLMGKILQDNGLPRDLIFLAMAESGFQNNAKSWARAVGPWQFMPYTGRKFGLNIDWYVDERRDPIKATIAAAQYLKKLYEIFGAWELAAAGYNAGEGKVGRAVKRYGTENFWKIRKGRYLKLETREYVPKIMALAIIGKNLKSFGFEEIDFHEPLDFEEIDVPGMTDLVLLSEKMDIPFEEIERLNPEVLRWFTPPSENNYKLRVPVGYKKVAMECCAQMDELKATAFQKYRVRGRKSNVQDVARKFLIKNKYVLESLNNTSSYQVLSQDSVVLLPFREGQSRTENMYADLYEKPRKTVVRARKYKQRIRRALASGKKISAPSKYYTVQRGDSLWSVSRKTGVSLDTIIASNAHIVGHRMIRAGDRLVIE